MELYTNQKFNPSDAHQCAIRDAVIDFVINCNQPMSVVDDEGFRKMMTTAQPKYIPICR